MDFIFEGDYNERRDLGFRVQQPLRQALRLQRRRRLQRARSAWATATPTSGSCAGTTTSRRSSTTTSSGRRRSWPARPSQQRPGGSSRPRHRQRPAEVERLASAATGTWAAPASTPAARECTTPRTTTRPPTTALHHDPAVADPELQATSPCCRRCRGPGQGSFLGDVLRNTYFKQGYTLELGLARATRRTTQPSYNASGNWSLNVRPPRLRLPQRQRLGQRRPDAGRASSSTGRRWVRPRPTPTGYCEDVDYRARRRPRPACASAIDAWARPSTASSR